MSFRRSVLAAFLIIGGFGSGTVSTQEQPLYKSGTRTVPIYATVLDARGRLVPDLNQSDFSVVDNGKAVTLAVFSREPQPFTAIVMLDTSASMTANLEMLNRAAEQFVLRLLPQDRAQVGAFNDKIQLSGTFTNDRDALVSALDELQFGNPTRLHDAIAASLDALRGVDGRRVVLVFTDGDDTASRLDFKAVLARARDEEVMVYAIGMESEYFDGMRLRATRPSRDLRRIAEETGGGYFELTKTDDLGRTFSRVAEELRSQYLLGVAPANLDGKLHKLDVRVSRPGMTVRARRTYLASPERSTGGPR
jgi:Ca-activated chloride channel family protein